jgi:hypothetical protein
MITYAVVGKSVKLVANRAGAAIAANGVVAIGDSVTRVELGTFIDICG